MLQSNLLISIKTLEQINNYLNLPSQALLLEGEKHLGKTSMLRLIASNLSKDSSLELYEIGLNDGAIKLEEIKNLKNFTKLQVTDNATRVITIVDADRMTHETQNSLLKLLEEPPKRTYFLLSSSDTSGLLQTILSRVQRIRVLAPSKDEFVDYFVKQGLSEIKAEKDYMRSGGRAGIVIKTDDTLSTEGMNIAKELLSTDPGKRLFRVDELLKNDALLGSTLESLERILQIGYKTSAAKGQDISSWIKRLSAIEQAQTELSYGISKRTSVTKLLVNL
jgi:DNA polymerase III delta prime subunit